MMDEYPRRRDPRKIVLALVVVVAIVVAAFAFFATPKPKIYVYTYDSLLMWGDNPDTIDDVVFGPFEQQYGVDIEIVRLNTDASGIVSRLVAEAENPIADVVIGIDNILILQEQARQVLTPYTPSNLDLVSSELVNILDPDHYLTPFDYGVVALIYERNLINETTNPELGNLTFADLAQPALASSLVIENPRLSSPGLAFFLSEVAVYHSILSQDWRDWWYQVRDKIDVQEGWSEAWSKWSEDPTRNIMVSYGTDPAYSAYYSGTAPHTAIALFHYNDADYAWLQVEGIGLVKNGPHPDIAKAFIDYCLTDAVQSHIALNQWMFPAASSTTLPDAYQYAVHPDDVAPLNTLLDRSLIQANLTDWLDQYDAIMTG